MFHVPCLLALYTWRPKYHYMRKFGLHTAHQWKEPNIVIQHKLIPLRPLAQQTKYVPDWHPTTFFLLAGKLWATLDASRCQEINELLVSY